MAASLSASKPTYKNSSNELQRRLRKLFGDALREVRASGNEIEDLLSAHWLKVESELREPFANTLARTVARIRKAIPITVPSIKAYEPDEYSRDLTIISDLTVEPGEYKLTFEGFLNPEEKSIPGQELMRRANTSGAIAGLQHALWLDYRKYREVLYSYTGSDCVMLVFAGTQATCQWNGKPKVLCIRNAGRMSLDWHWLDWREFGELPTDDHSWGFLLARATKI